MSILFSGFVGFEENFSDQQQQEEDQDHRTKLDVFDRQKNTIPDKVESIPRKKVTLDKKKKRGKNTMLTSTEAFAISCTAAGLAHVVHHPLYTLKSHMMMHGSAFRPRIFLQNIWSNPRFLYRGLVARTLGVMPEKAFKMQAWYIGDNLMKKYYKDATMTSWLVAGSFAGLATTIIGCPSERIMVLAQIRKQGIFEVIRTTGLRGLYKGAVVTSCRDISFNAVFFTATEGIVKAYIAYSGKEQDSAMRYKAGLVAGVLASVGACPLDVAKTRIQGQKLGEPKLGMVEVFRTIIRNEGPRYLFKGLLPRLIAVPSMMSFFYMLNVYFNNWFASK